MKRVITLVFTLLLMCGVSYSQTVSVNKIISLNAYGPVPAYLPTTLSIVCDGTGAAGNNCPQYWSPDWTDTNETNAFGYTNQSPPGRCLKSTNAAVSWSYCGADPFTGFVSTTGQPGAFAVASDGALLVAANINNGTQACVIRRSTDGGDTWTTVHTQNGTYFCGAYSTTAMPSPMKCAKSANTCVLYGNDVATTVFVAVFYSTDNGMTWNAPTGTLGTAIGPPQVGSAMSDDGTISITGITTGASTRTFVYTRDGSTYVASAAWGTAIGSSRCTGPFIYNTDPAVMCAANNSTQTWQMVRINSNTPQTIAQFLLGDGSPLSSNGPDVIGIQWDDDTFYLITRLHATGGTNVYVTTDNFTSMHFLGTLTPAITFASNPRGDIYKWKNSVYWSSGYHTPNGHIMRIS